MQLKVEMLGTFVLRLIELLFCFVLFYELMDLSLGFILVVDLATNICVIL